MCTHCTRSCVVLTHNTHAPHPEEVRECNKIMVQRRTRRRRREVFDYAFSIGVNCLIAPMGPRLAEIVRASPIVPACVRACQRTSVPACVRACAGTHATSIKDSKPGTVYACAPSERADRTGPGFDGSIVTLHLCRSKCERLMHACWAV